MNASEATEFETAIDAALAEFDLGHAEELAARYGARAGTGPGADAARSPWFRACYLAAQVALAAGRLREAEHRLAPLLALAHTLPAELACRVWLLSAEARARLGDGDLARERLLRVSEAVLRRMPVLRLQQLRIRLWLGEVGMLAGELTGCGRDLEAAGDLANQCLLICEEGRAHDVLGDLDRAAACWRQAEQLSRPLASDPIRADVLLQLGRLAHLRGWLQQALDHYENALAATPAAPQARELRLRRILVLLDLNQWGQARFEFARALADVPAGQLPEELYGLAATVATLLGEDTPHPPSAELRGYLLAQTDREAARDLYRKAFDEGRAPARRARQALGLGLLALVAADRAEAERWLKQAEELARQLDLPEVLWRALEARGRLAAELDSDEGRSRQLIEEAVLVSEMQAGRLRHRTDAAAYHLHRGDVLRLLARAACRRGDAGSVFRFQELDRGRLLLELWRGAGRRPGEIALDHNPDFVEVERNLAACVQQLQAAGTSRDTFLRRHEELLILRDRLFDDFLRDRSRHGDHALPSLPELTDLEKVLPAGAVYLAPSLVDGELWLLVVRRGRGGRIVPPSDRAESLSGQLDAFRQCLGRQLDRYAQGFPLGRPERAELDARLEDLGRGPLGSALDRALDDGAHERIVWVPDGTLHGLPLHALRRRGRYLVQDHEVVYAFGGALLVHQARAQRGRRFGPALVVAETGDVLPTAGREAAGVAGAFFRSHTLQGEAATLSAVRRRLPSASVLHLACHANFDVNHPLAASVELPSGESWRGLDWLDEPVDGLPLVTLSACRSAEVAPLVGREVFGLAAGLLGGGVRAVLAGLWPVADRETLPLMWRFYRERMTRDLAGALAEAQRLALAEPDSSPLFWAAFALFGDPATLPAPPRWLRWWARWRQRRHTRRFPLSAKESPDEPQYGPLPAPARRPNRSDPASGISHRRLARGYGGMGDCATDPPAGPRAAPHAGGARRRSRPDARRRAAGTW